MDTMITEAHGGSYPVPEMSPQADGTAPTPQIIVYNYRIGGVTYECAQDVTTLAEYGPRHSDGSSGSGAVSAAESGEQHRCRGVVERAAAERPVRDRIDVHTEADTMQLAD